MKKLSLLVLLVIVATTLMAAVPTKMIRLTIINKSDPVDGSAGDFAVYMKLTGSEVTGSYYYLTVPAGSRDEPVVKVFTIMSDAYQRQTWQCNGVRSSGWLIASGNMRLTFTPCGQFACWKWGDDRFFTNCAGDTVAVYRRKIQSGEPRMEKVTYFRYLAYGQPHWSVAELYAGYWNFGCFTWYYRFRTWRTPIGCQFHYQY